MTTTTHRRRPASEGGYTCGDETSLRIIEAALTLFGERGFEGASTRDIAELATKNHALVQDAVRASQTLTESASAMKQAMARFSY